MNNPEVSIDNIQAVHDHFLDNKINHRFVKFAHWIFGHAIRSDISYWDEQNGEQYLAQRMSEDARVVMAANHRTIYDQFVLAALPEQIEPLEPLIDNTFIPTKIELYQIKGLAGKLIYWAISNLRAKPTFRKSNFPDPSDPRRSQANVLHEDSVCFWLSKGEHEAIFPEGTRNKSNPHEVQDIHPGVARTIMRTQVDIDFITLPVGIEYGSKKPKHKLKGNLGKIQRIIYDVKNHFTPTVHIGKPIEGKLESTEQYCNLLKPALQESVDISVARRAEKNKN